MPANAKVKAQAAQQSPAKRRRVDAASDSEVPVGVVNDVDVNNTAAAATTTASSTAIAAGGAQVSWEAIWRAYRDIVNSKNAGSKENPENGIYDLIVQATYNNATDTFKAIDPGQAMLAAKHIFEALSNEKKEAVYQKQEKKMKQWRWSPQSTQARKHLAAWYATGGLTVEGTVDQGLARAFDTGWRWLPIPDFANSSHNHRWYAPASLMKELQAADVKFAVGTKKVSP